MNRKVFGPSWKWLSEEVRDLLRENSACAGRWYGWLIPWMKLINTRSVQGCMNPSQVHTVKLRTRWYWSRGRLATKVLYYNRCARKWMGRKKCSKWRECAFDCVGVYRIPTSVNRSRIPVFVCVEWRILPAKEKIQVETVQNHFIGLQFSQEEISRIYLAFFLSLIWSGKIKRFFLFVYNIILYMVPVQCVPYEAS